MLNSLPIAIIGAGPVGLAAAAHLIQRGENPIILEMGDTIGANMRQWAHVRMFSPWRYVVDSAAVALLEESGWQMPDGEGIPTGGELIDNYLMPLVNLPAFKDRIQLGAKVAAVSRQGKDKLKSANRDERPFVLQVQYRNGNEERLLARAVIDASGTWHQPNPVGGDGLPALGEAKNQNAIYYGIPNLGQDVKRYGNQRVLVVGGGHSAINSLINLVRIQEQFSQTQILWALRSTNLNRIYGGGENDELPARGKLGQEIKSLVESGKIRILAPLSIESIEKSATGLRITGETGTTQIQVEVDQIIANTGARPDLNMIRELRIAVHESLEAVPSIAPLIDPNLHSCGTVPPHGEAELRQPESNFYIVGMKSYGRAPTFLLLTGYEQVRSVAAALVGDWESARDVQLVLPETGVCSSDDGCCSVPSIADATPVVNLISLNTIPVGVAPKPVIAGNNCCS